MQECCHWLKHQFGANVHIELIFIMNVDQDRICTNCVKFNNLERDEKFPHNYSLALWRQQLHFCSLFLNPKEMWDIMGQESPDKKKL